MARPNWSKGQESDIAHQKLIFDRIVWSHTTTKQTPLLASVYNNISLPPIGGATTSMTGDIAPYWVFELEVGQPFGLKLKNISVKDTQSSGSTEEVFHSIEFDDLIVTMDDGAKIPFDMNKAFSNPASCWEYYQNGVQSNWPAPSDQLFQRGMKLTLVNDNILPPPSVCKVTLELSVVFRGAGNDFDPGRVPVALKVYPQIAWTWHKEKATSKVKNFRGSVKMTVMNKMYHLHGGHHVSAPNGNIAGFFADSNTSIIDLNTSMYPRPGVGLNAVGGIMLRQGPFGWSMVFDYNYLFKNGRLKEKEIVGVYGPKGGNKFRKQFPREGTYSWPDSDSVIHVNKADRQGYYDNIHLHAMMGTPDKYGNIQVHAPFCGHSCFHAHWRWSKMSVNYALPGKNGVENGWYYKGWSNPEHGRPEQFSDDDAPLIPPNQHLTVALCKPNAIRYSEDHIVDPSNPSILESLKKLFWYCVDIVNPNADEKQVIFGHGAGWAYRYALPDESDAVAGLMLGLHNAQLIFKWASGTLTQEDISIFFEKEIYPTFRYIGGSTSSAGTNQVPEGDWDIYVSNQILGPSLHIGKMEEL